MAKLKISGKELRKIGYPEGRAIGMAINVVHQHFKKEKKEKMLALLRAVFENPEAYADDEALGRIVAELQPPAAETKQEIPLNPVGIGYKTYGLEAIEAGAVEQMNIAARLPVSVGAALMPDAHRATGCPSAGCLRLKMP